jgi:hypothetical protein
MTADEFRALALSLPETIEAAHMGHPDFRVLGKIFATLGYPDEAWGVVSLSPEKQAEVCTTEPEVFFPVKGAWGRAGSTQVYLRLARKRSVRGALRAAWENRRPGEDRAGTRRSRAAAPPKKRGPRSTHRGRKRRPSDAGY